MSGRDRSHGKLALALPVKTVKMSFLELIKEIAVC